MTSWAWSCIAGECVNHGCADDEHCGPGSTNDTCVVEDTFGSCWQGCSADEDCPAPTLCTGAGGIYCEWPPCVSDEDCSIDSTCNPRTGECQLAYECVDANSCFGEGMCVEGFCRCTADEQCSGGRVCHPDDERPRAPR